MVSYLDQQTLGGFYSLLPETVPTFPKFSTIGPKKTDLIHVTSHFPLTIVTQINILSISVHRDSTIIATERKNIEIITIDRFVLHKFDDIAW